jgi:hypothetical protein
MILVLPSTRKRRVTSQIETQKCHIFSTIWLYTIVVGLIPIRHHEVQRIETAPKSWKALEG